jgi:4-oxalocrotonate tautomerase
MAEGRSPEQIRELMHALHDAAVNIAKAPPEAVSVIITEVAPDKWATADVTIQEKREAAQK